MVIGVDKLKEEIINQALRKANALCGQLLSVHAIGVEIILATPDD
jgi:hypothetical protein